MVQLSKDPILGVFVGSETFCRSSGLFYPAIGILQNLYASHLIDLKALSSLWW